MSQGTVYNGTISTTVSGKECQEWAKTTPHSHEHSKSLPANYCRSPDSGSGFGVWCYTTDINTRWDYCDVPKCSERKLK